ncbi:hypothetical protein [Solimonas marina]|uniref:hypothetical protein n=1 Tax=Solimonas marina TaxID=2714601 RepID=UPI0014398D8D|nr:hypothetical protein [Solimonas marina]
MLEDGWRDRVRWAIDLDRTRAIALHCGMMKAKQHPGFRLKSFLNGVLSVIARLGDEQAKENAATEKGAQL